MKTLNISKELKLPLNAVTQTFAIMAKSQQIAWAAGLFEGEGCIAYVPTQNKGTRRALFVGMTDLDVLERLQTVVGAGVIRKMKVYGNRKPAWRWEVQDWENVHRIGLLFYPYLCLRRRKRMDELFAHPPKRGVGRCYSCHPLIGPDADVYIHPGRTPQCAICARAREKRRRRIDNA